MSTIVPLRYIGRILVIFSTVVVVVVVFSSSSSSSSSAFSSYVIIFTYPWHFRYRGGGNEKLMKKLNVGMTVSPGGLPTQN